ncbi:M20/M25/M40 family metallo-hydrolase, partial [Streptomyces sp. NPDC058953]|uniref:M20/M25/M40 family metallo-hydrolase n=1 Tax=Streptomyces sp. NPDC058953 TaxID=3346676 RepID=UPI003686B1F2
WFVFWVYGFYNTRFVVSPPPLPQNPPRLLGGSVPVLGTGAGHDAGILSGSVPTAMLFVRNPTGVSHSPAESAAEDDCVAGVLALADVVEGLACETR